MDYAYELTLFNCSSKGDSDPILCLSSPQYQVYAVYSASSIGAFDLLSCTKIRDMSPVPYDYLRYQQRILGLSWDNPKCKDCEVKGKYRRLKSNNTASETQCYGMLVFKPHKAANNSPAIPPVGSPVPSDSSDDSPKTPKNTITAKHSCRFEIALQAQAKFQVCKSNLNISKTPSALYGIFPSQNTNLS
ncbi:hypothetical protein GH714_010295 [Hevea brasiliensis]|uniref:RING-type E3 ubiquitin transferase n=1 Tax=Hevea brasiliensis TaxID=3981 RepID=A0A6A6LI10_HEVBR|nr:hypothetical protein GH714_010295 [Hevea brasiliensis]